MFLQDLQPQELTYISCLSPGDTQKGSPKIYSNHDAPLDFHVCRHFSVVPVDPLTPRQIR